MGYGSNSNGWQQVMVYIAIALIAILAGIACYRIDQAKRERGESDKSGAPWNWEGWS